MNVNRKNRRQQVSHQFTVGKVKRKVELPKKLKFLDFDPASFNLLRDDSRDYAASLTNSQKNGRDPAKRKQGLCSAVEKRKGKILPSPKVRCSLHGYSSIFNDSYPFEESPFSKIAKTVRKDMGLRYIGLDKYHSPGSLRECQSHHICSGCMSNLSASSLMDTLSMEKSLTFSEMFEKKVAFKTPEVVTEADNIRNKTPEDSLSLSTIHSSSCSSFSSSSDTNEECDSLFPNRIERLSMLVITSTPINKINLASSKKETKSSVNSKCTINQTKARKKTSGRSALPTPTFQLEVEENHNEENSNEENNNEEKSNEENSNEENSNEEKSPSSIDHLLHSSKTAILTICGQLTDVDFSSYITERSPIAFEKVGEGAFSEVFACFNEKGIHSVWKVQPFQGDLIFNGMEQKNSSDILSEILLTSTMSDLRNGEKFMVECFVETLNFKCVHGPFPKVLLDCWRKYDDEKGSENDCPSMFPDTQLILITEMKYAGVALEDFVFTSAPQALSVFTQVAYALAVAEEAVEFEHRDLHWGNIMVSKTSVQDMSYIMNEKKTTLKTRGVTAKIVDYSLSRATINGCFHYADLAGTPEIFESTGEYQFEIYRLMRNHKNNEWEKFTPYTNVLWLHYLILQMCHAVKYKNKKAKIHREYMKKMVAISSCILKSTSAVNYVSLQEYYS